MSKSLPQWQKDVNQVFFTNLLKTLKEGGTWVWAETGYQYTKKGDHLCTNNKEAYEAVTNIAPSDCEIFKLEE